MSGRYLFTSSSNMRGHPDKLCDRISDALVDSALTIDVEGRISAETAAAGQVIFVTTEARLRGEIDVTGIVRRTIGETGYDPRDLDPDRCVVLAQTSVMSPPWVTQSPEPSSVVFPAIEQATVFGYACSETPERMPLPIRLAHQIAGRLDQLCIDSEIPSLGPDGSVAVTVEYADHQPVRVDAIVMQLLHHGSEDFLRDAVRARAVEPILMNHQVRGDSRTRTIVNAEGPLIVGGPARDAGHTGRKQASDTYGGASRRGDGALSGKDPSRIDRSATYAARHVATNVVAAGLATECEVMLSYAIGDVEPATISARTFGTGTIPDEKLSETIQQVFDLRPAAIAQRLRLWTLPKERDGRFYRDLAVGGHFGRPEMRLPWEELDAVEELRAHS
ncbi:MAG TPA: methionine adenosyltransferase [Chloroflexota bacterium]|nr:methionine adenosyltransferase [Chloroflexota bacterium]